MQSAECNLHTSDTIDNLAGKLSACPIDIRRTLRKQWKQVTVLAFLVLVLLAILTSRVVRPYPPTFVYGNLSSEDVSAIKGVINHNLRVKLFPKWSWANVASLPGSIRIYFGQHIQSISLEPNGMVKANVRYHGSRKGPRAELHLMVKTSKGWTVTYVQLLVD